MAEGLSQKLDLQLTGLYTSPNNFSAVPQGSLLIADNVVINNKNIIASRRGQKQYGNPLTISSGQVDKIFNYVSSLIINYDDKLAYDSGNGVWVNYAGSFEPPDADYKMRSLEALKNFYFTTSEGIGKLDSLTSVPRQAGVPKALGGTATTTGSTGFLIENTAVAYRIVWGYEDANKNLLLGAPSQRLVVANPNGSGVDVDVVLTYVIPATITTEYFYQIYRSRATATALDEPSDELQLVEQGNPTAAQITAKSFTITDQTPYTLMRATLYTSPSQEGISNANYQPPLALDMDIFKGSAFYANIRQKQKLTLTLISVEFPSLGYYVDASTGTTDTSPTLTTIADTSDLRIGMRIVGTGIPSGTTIIGIPSATTVTMSANATATGSVSVEFQDRFSIGGVNYWAGSANNVSTNTFFVDATSTPGPNINATALNLIQIINTSASNTTIYADYLSALDELPGVILFEERTIGGAQFTATSTSGGSFSPELPDQYRITANSLANPTVVTSTAHGLTSGDSITIYNSNSTPTINGARIVTVLTSDTFSIPVDVTGAGTSGYWIKTDEMVNSDNEVKQNRVAISKPGQVEAVPLYTYFDIGSANFEIQRVVALRDGIFFFKKDGIYRISGEGFSSYVVTLLDNTVTLKAPESAVPFNNQVFCFTTQGVCAVTDGGVEIKSVPIENTLLEISSEQYTNFASASFGVAYESSRQYMFFTVTEEDDEFATQAFIYNSITDTWTRWIMNRTCGVVNQALNKLFMAEADTGQIMIERKTFTNEDFADQEFAVDIASVDSSTQVTLTSAADVVMGMTLVQSNRRAYIESVDGNVLTITATNNLVTGAATVYEPIENIIEWNPIDCENPGILKQFSEISLFFQDAAFSSIDVTFSSNITGATSTVPIANNSGSGGWGNFNWGAVPWGGSYGGQAVLRTYVTRNQQRCSWLGIKLKTEESFTGFSLKGVSLMFNPMSSRIK